MSTPLLTILLVQMAAVMSPGPDFLFVTRTAMSQSRARAVWGAAGITEGMLFWSVVSMTGLHVLFLQMAWLQGVVGVLGGLYLASMGLGLLKSAFTRPGAPRGRASDDAGGGEPMRHPFLYGCLTNLSNPKAIVYFASIFSAFISAEASLWDFGLLLAIVVGETFFWFLFVALLFGLPRFRSGYRRLARWIDGAAGTIFGVLGLTLIFSAVGGWV